MGFSHVCLAPPFEPGGSGDIFVHATFDRLHPALGFAGSAEQGLALAAELAAGAGLRLMLDIAPGQVAIDLPLRQRQPDWFSPGRCWPGGRPEAAPHRIDVAVPRFGQTALADAVSDWWIELLTRLTGAGIAGFRCLTLDLVPASFWRRLIATFPSACSWPGRRGSPACATLAGVGFDLTCSSAGWWDGRASWFLDEQDALRDIAPALASPGTLLPRPAGATVGAGRGHRRVLSSGAADRRFDRGGSVSADGLRIRHQPRRFDSVRASPADMEAAERERPADLSEDIAAAYPTGRGLAAGRPAAIDHQPRGAGYRPACGPMLWC